VHEFINQPDGTLEVTLVALYGDSATVTLSAPCGLEEEISVEVVGGALRPVYLPLIRR
jgi:hypothetical protein